MRRTKNVCGQEMELFHSNFLNSSNLILLMIVLVTSALEPDIILEKVEAWFPVNEQHSINCTLKRSVTDSFDIYWTRNGQVISELPMDAKLKEIKVNYYQSQLIFENTSISESANYTCHARNASFTANSSVAVHIGEKPSATSYTCLYVPDSNIVWYFPILDKENKNNKFKFKFCKSSFSNIWCNSHAPNTWEDAISMYFNKTTKGYRQKQVLKFSTYVISIDSENRYGKTNTKTTTKNIPQQCIHDHRPKIKVELLDIEGRSSFYISWHLPRGDEMSNSEITILTTKDSKQAIKPIAWQHRCDGPFNQCTREIPGKSILPCTDYTICIKNLLLSETNSPTVSCITKATKNNYIPGLIDVRFTVGSARNWIEFQWRDPEFYEKGPFFYKYTLQFRNTKKQQGIIYKRTNAAFNRINGSRGIFTVEKCTLCGCGEKVVKGFELQSEPMPNFVERKPKSKGSISTPVVVVVCFLILLIIIGILLLIMWKRRRNKRAQRNQEEQIQELEDVVMPANQYEEVQEVPHYYDVIRTQDSESEQNGNVSLET